MQSAVLKMLREAFGVRAWRVKRELFSW